MKSLIFIAAPPSREVISCGPTMSIVQYRTAGSADEWTTRIMTHLVERGARPPDAMASGVEATGALEWNRS
jgi:hypothetical protein